MLLTTTFKKILKKHKKFSIKCHFNRNSSKVFKKFPLLQQKNLFHSTLHQLYIIIMKNFRSLASIQQQLFVQWTKKVLFANLQCIKVFLSPLSSFRGFGLERESQVFKLINFSWLFYFAPSWKFPWSVAKDYFGHSAR